MTPTLLLFQLSSRRVYLNDVRILYYGRFSTHTPSQVCSPTSDCAHTHQLKTCSIRRLFDCIYTVVRSEATVGLLLLLLLTCLPWLLLLLVSEPPTSWLPDPPVRRRLLAQQQISTIQSVGCRRVNQRVYFENVGAGSAVSACCSSAASSTGHLFRLQCPWPRLCCFVCECQRDDNP